MEEIRQDSEVRLSAKKGNYLKMIFFNLTGRNFNHKDAYRLYLRFALAENPDLHAGPIEFWSDGQLIEKGMIADLKRVVPKSKARWSPCQ